MTDNTSPRDPLPDLVAALESGLRLTQCSDVAALRQLSPAQGGGFVVGRRIRVGNYYDLQPAITIYDPALGTLAFVEHVLRSGKDPSAAAWAAIERATGVRQILIDEAARQQQQQDGKRVLPLQIELVLLASGAVPSGKPDPIRTTLTKVARETGYLRLIGLSVLDVEQHPALSDDVLRRAFAWLLRGTSVWFARIAAAPATAGWRNGNTAIALTLQDYRLAGTRRFSCSGDAWLHLVHGHNGSGKSSIAEAVELLLTSRIQRLDEAAEANYFRIVRHRPFGMDDETLAGLGPCHVALGADGELVSKVSIENGKQPARDGQSPSSALQTNSFRLDQVFMDKLIRTQAAGRAALFLNAFSPGDAPLLERLQQLRRDVRSSWQTLPEHVRRKAESEMAATRTADATAQVSGSSLTEDEMAAFVVREFGALYPSAGSQQAGDQTAPPEPAMSRSALEGLLPIGQSELEKLAQIHPPVRERMEALLAVTRADALPDALAQFESALNTLRSSLSLNIADLATALRVFQEFRSWNVGRRSRDGDFDTDIRRWLELQALVDLTTRYAEIATAVESALGGSWVVEPRDGLLAGIGTGGTAAALLQRRAELSAELSIVRRRVEASSESETDAPEQPSAPTRRWLLAAEVESLNRVGQFLSSTRGPELLGVRFNRALASGREEGLAKGGLGRSGGLDHAIEEAVDLKQACEALQHASGLGAASGADLRPRTAVLVESARKLQALASDLPKSFFYRLAGRDRQELNDLVAAFNELLALITPARWVYRDVRLHADLSNDAPSLGLQTVEGAPAELLFNTAELNASALVLFLLLAPRLPNDLRLLVLDDPLQNMDELTVVTLGRALAKLRIFYVPKDWVVLAFFHGEDNVQRIRDEAPCKVYHLPWLQGEPEPIEASENQDFDWQTAFNVIADSPARTAT